MTDYTPGDPIFEYGGESERKYAAITDNFDDDVLEMSIDDLLEDLSAHEDDTRCGWVLYSLARELERRRLNG